VGLTTSSPSVSRVSRQYACLDVSQPYGPSWPVAGIALTLPVVKAATEFYRCGFYIAVLSDVSVGRYFLFVRMPS
jgi:hypothetical protein